MIRRLTPIPLHFWKSAAGGEPVRDWLRALPRDDRHRIGEDLRELQFEWPLGMPLVRALGQGLSEVRSDLASGRAARVLLGFDGGRAILLHGFAKTTQKAPAADLALARRRLKEMKG